MVNRIIYGISNALSKSFQGVRIYVDNVEQGLEEPCFFIVPLISKEKPLLDVRAMRSISFDVHYFTRSGNLDLQATASTLYRVLKRITLLKENTFEGESEEMLNGFNMRHEVVDGVLHFFVDYKPLIRYEKDPVEKQENLDLKMGVD